MEYCQIYTGPYTTFHINNIIYTHRYRYSNAVLYHTRYLPPLDVQAIFIDTSFNRWHTSQPYPLVPKPTFYSILMWIINSLIIINLHLAITGLRIRMVNSSTCGSGVYTGITLQGDSSSTLDSVFHLIMNLFEF